MVQNPNQIKDPLANELRDLAEEAIDGVDHGAEPSPEKYVELVFGPEIVELDGFMDEIKVRCRFALVHMVSFMAWLFGPLLVCCRFPLRGGFLFYSGGGGYCSAFFVLVVCVKVRMRATIPMALVSDARSDRS